jgi:hypothetical protein
MKKLLPLILSTLLLTSCSGPETSGGATVSKTEGSSAREARPNTNYGQSANHSADRNVQQATKLKVTSPNGGEKWAVGRVQKIEWNKDSEGPNVIIRVMTGKKFTDVVALKTKNDGSHSWKIPSSFKTGKNYKIDVQSFTGHYACAYWSDYLTYKPGWGRAIVSKKNDGLNKFVTFWSSAGGNDAKDAAWASCVSKYGSCQVIDVDGNVCKSTATAYDSSDKYFTITKSGGGGSSLKVSTPNGGESWNTGKTQSIKWSKGNAGANVKIELLKSGKKSLTIAAKTKNDGKHTWKIPATVATASTYKIRITSSTKKTVNDSSDSNFTITKASGGGGAKGCMLFISVYSSVPEGGRKRPQRFLVGPSLKKSKEVYLEYKGGWIGGAPDNPSAGKWSFWSPAEAKRLSVWVCGESGKWKNKWVRVKGPTNYCTGKYWDPTYPWEASQSPPPPPPWRKGAYFANLPTKWLEGHWYRGAACQSP